MCHVHIFLVDRLSMYENGEKIIDAMIEDRKELQGGRIGVFSMSQEKVTWSALSIACPTVEKRYVCRNQNIRYIIFLEKNNLEQTMQRLR